MKEVLDFLQSEAGIQLLALISAVVLYLLRMRGNAQDKKNIDLAIRLANMIEKAIPDGYDSKLDAFLGEFEKEYNRINGKIPSKAIMGLARGVLERWVADRNSGRHL